LHRERKKSGYFDWVRGSSKTAARFCNLKSNKNRQQARVKKPLAKLRVENRKEEKQIYLSSFVVAEWLAC
jgi:diaminopimelate epimerase